MRRCVVNVIFENSESNIYYKRGQKRLADAMNEFDPGTRLRFYDSIPSHWPRHEDKPYAFKSFAMMEAAQDYDVVLWCDSYIVPIRPMEPLWKRIERDGYFLVEGGATNYQWTADSAYPDLFPGVPIDQARALSRTFKQIVGGLIGVNLLSEIGSQFFHAYYDLAANTNAFCGPWANSNCRERPIYGMDSIYTTAPCGPPDVIGHRHDQTAASVLAWRMKLKLAQYPAPYAYTTPGDGTILLHDGPGLADYLLPGESPPKVVRPQCPKCRSEALGMAGGMRHCNQCGRGFL